MLRAYVYYTCSTYLIIVSNGATFGITVDAAITFIEEVKETPYGKVSIKAKVMFFRCHAPEDPVVLTSNWRGWPLEIIKI